MVNFYFYFKLSFSLNLVLACNAAFSQSNLSDVADNTDYSTGSPQFNINPAYINFIDATSTSTGKIIAMKLRIRDGGSTLSDADNLSTILTGITFTVTDNFTLNKIDFIKTAILTTSAGSLIATATKSGSELVFSGMSGTDVAAIDNNDKIVHLRLSFNETQVIDNTKLVFTVSGVTASSSGSTFATTNGGAAASDNSNSNDRNRIEVAADRLRFAQQPSNSFVSTNMAPSPTVAAVDLYNNTDFDIGSGSASVTSTGTLSSTPQTAVFAAGSATFNSINHAATGTGLKLTATYSSFTPVSSNTFTITGVTYQAGDYRPSSSGIDFSTANAWESFNGSTWTTGVTAPQNLAAGSRPARIIIDKANISGANSSSNQYNNIIVTNGGELMLSENLPPVIDFISSGNSLEVLNGGTLVITGQININSTANFIVRSGGITTLNSGNIANNHGIWGGTENFEAGSFFNINNWDWSAASPNLSLINASADATTNNSAGYKFGILTVNINPTIPWSLVDGGTIKLCDTLNVSNSSVNAIAITSNTSSPSVTIGTIHHYGGTFDLSASFSGAATQTIDILHDLTSSSGTLKLFDGSGTGSASEINININGNLTVSNTSAGFTNEGGPSAKLNFTGTTLQHIDAAVTVTAVPINVKAGASVTLKNHDLTVNSLTSTAVAFTVETGGTLDFGFAADGTTPLVIKKVSSGVAGTNDFTSQTASTLKITSPLGLQKASATTGNIQLPSSNKTFSQTGTFWYTGKSNQVTGDCFTTASSAKILIVELNAVTTTLTLTNATGITNKLEIRQGTLISSSLNPITSSGQLIMSGGIYQIGDLSVTVPQLSGAYSLSGGTIQLNGPGNQVLRGGRDYHNLTFSNSGTKTLTSAPSSIAGTITVAGAAVLDVENNGMGGSSTNLTMTGTSKYKTAGSGLRPGAGGIYSLAPGTTIEFANNSTSLQTIRLTPNYANIEVSGANVGTTTASGSINLLASGSFTAKSGGVFKLQNLNGFSGSSNTAVSSVNNPIIDLENGSTIEYNASSGNQTITRHSNYSNLTLSNASNKTFENLVSISGNLTNASTGTVTTGTLMSFNGSFVTQSIAGLNWKNLSFHGSATKTITSNGSLTGVLSFSGNGVTLDADGPVDTVAFTLKSTSIDSTARISDLSNNNTTSGYSITGNVIVERFIPARRAYRYLSPSVNTVTSIKSNWMEGVNNTSTAANNNPHPGFGTHITGGGDLAASNAGEFDATNTNNPSLLTFDIAGQKWVTATTTSQNLVAGKGYRLFVRGDRSTDLSTNTPPLSNTVLRTTGTLVTGAVIFNKNSSVPINANHGTYSFLGNPYASPVNWNLLSKTDLSDTYVTFDPNVNTRGAYVYYYGNLDRNNFYGTASTSEVDKNIQPGQAFFVQTNAPSGSGNPELVFEESKKSSNLTHVYRPISKPAILSVQLLLNTNPGSPNIADATIAAFNDGFSREIGKEDANKLTNQDETIAINRNGTILSMEARPSVTYSDTIPLMLSQFRQNNYYLAVSGNNFSPSLTAFVEDSYLNTQTSLDLLSSTFLPFTINKDSASFAPGRFRIVLKPDVVLPITAINLKAFKKEQGIQVDWVTQTETNIDEYHVEKSVDGQQYFTIGKEKARGNSIRETYSWLDQNPSTGINFYRVKVIEKMGVIKYSHVVNVAVSNLNASLAIYPNPAKGNVIGLRLINQEKGTYQAELYSTAGQKLFTGQIKHNGGSAKYSIATGSTFSKGTYRLKVYNSQTSMIETFLVE